MAIIKLEDLEAVVEGLIFPAAFAKISSYVQAGTVVLIKGRVNLREDTPKIAINDMIPIDAVYKLISAFNINLSGIRENLFESLKELLSTSPGSVPVYLHLDTPHKSKVQLVVDERLYVLPSEKLIRDIENLLGGERLTLTI